MSGTVSRCEEARLQRIEELYEALAGRLASEDGARAEALSSLRKRMRHHSYLDVIDKDAVNAIVALEERMHLFMQQDKERYLRGLRFELAQALGDSNVYGSVLGLLLALANQPLTTSLGDISVDVSMDVDALAGEEAREEKEGACSSSSRDHIEFDEEDAGQWSEGSDLSSERWASDDSISWSDDGTVDELGELNSAFCNGKGSDTGENSSMGSDHHPDHSDHSDQWVTISEDECKRDVGSSETTLVQLFANTKKKKFSCMECESEVLLVRHLMLHVCGVSGTLLEALANGENFSGTVQRIKKERPIYPLKTSTLTNQTLKTLLRRELDGGVSVCSLQTTLQSVEGYSRSPTRQAFARSVMTCLDEVLLTPREIDVMAKAAERDVLRGCPTLLHCHIALQGVLEKIEFFNNLARDALRTSVDSVCEDKDVEAVEAVHVLWTICRTLDDLTLESNSTLYTYTLRILSETLVPYIGWIEAWLAEGEVRHNEFMVMKSSGDESCQGEEGALYRLRDEGQQPHFLRASASQILAGGTSRRLLKLKGLQQQSEKNSDLHGILLRSFQNELQKLIGERPGDEIHHPVDLDESASRLNLSAVADPEGTDNDMLSTLSRTSLLGSFCETRNVEWRVLGLHATEYDAHGRDGNGVTRVRTKKAGQEDDCRARSTCTASSATVLESCLIHQTVRLCSNISSEFLTSLMNRWKLRKAMRSMRDIFLMGNGELFQTFLPQLFERIDSADEWRDQQEIDGLFYEALGSRLPGCIPHIEEFGLYIKLTAASLPEDGDLSPISETDIIRVGCTIPRLFELVIDEAALCAYQRSFCFLMKLRRALYMVERLQMDFSQHSCSNARLWRLYIELRHFVKNFHRYVMECVVHSAGAELEKGIDEAVTVDDVCRSHAQFIRRVSRLCLFSDEPIWRVLGDRVHTILEVIGKVYVLWQSRHQDGGSREGDVEERVEGIEGDFHLQTASLFRLLKSQMKLKNSASQFGGLLLCLDFNGYYKHKAKHGRPQT